MTGAGGCGKTRLAVQLAADVARSVSGRHLARRARDGHRPRARRRDHRRRARRARPQRRSPRGDRDPRRRPADARRARQLRAPAGRRWPTLADALLRRCESLTLLATSREPLGVPGRDCVAGAVDARARSGAPQRIETLSQFDAVRLFLERATQGATQLRAHVRERARGRADLPPPRGHPARRRAGCGARAGLHGRAGRPPGSTTGSGCSPAARARWCPASRPCKRRSTGATTCCPSASGPCSVGSRCSRAGSRSTRPSRSPPAATSKRWRCSTSSSRSSTSR